MLVLVDIFSIHSIVWYLLLFLVISRFSVAELFILGYQVP